MPRVCLEQATWWFQNVTVSSYVVQESKVSLCGDIVTPHIMLHESYWGNGISWLETNTKLARLWLDQKDYRGNARKNLTMLGGRGFALLSAL